MNYQFLKEITSLDNVGKNSNNAFYQIEYYTDENLNKMGYPTKRNKINIVDSVKNPSLGQTNFQQHILQEVLSKELGKLDNKGIVINDDMTTSENKAILNEIDIIIEKIASNIQSGAFFYLIVGDMYTLLNLFQKTIYKFNYETLEQYDSYLRNLFDYLNEEKHVDSYKIWGNDKQVRNLVKLVYDIYKRIEGMFKLMMKNRYDPIFNRKNALEAYLKESQFKSIDVKYHNALKQQYDSDLIKLEYAKGKDKALATEQVGILKELLTRTPYPAGGMPYSSEDGGYPTPVPLPPFGSASDAPYASPEKAPIPPTPRDTIIEMSQSSIFDFDTQDFFDTYEQYVKTLRKSLSGEELDEFNDNVGKIDEGIIRWKNMADYATTGGVNPTKIEMFGNMYNNMADYIKLIDEGYGLFLENIGVSAFNKIALLPAMEATEPPEPPEGAVESKVDVEPPMSQMDSSLTREQEAILANDLTFFSSGHSNKSEGLFERYFILLPKVQDVSHTFVMSASDYVQIPAPLVKQAEEQFPAYVNEKNRKKCFKLSDVKSKFDLYEFLYYPYAESIMIRSSSGDSPVIEIHKDDSFYLLDTQKN